MQLPCLGVCKGVQNKGCRVIVHTCRFKVSPKNGGFSINFREFGSHYYNGINLKSGYLSLKSKKSAHPERLRMYQTCCTFMPTYYAFDTLHTLTMATTATFKCYKFAIETLFPKIIDVLFFGLLIFY